MRIPKGPATDVLVVSQVLLWLGLLLTGRQNWAMVELGFIPGLIGAAFTSGDIGAILDAAVGRPIAAAFVHVAFFQMLLNMMLLLFTGRFVEGAMGSRSFLILYGVSLLAAALAEFLVAPSSLGVSVGASGALSGVFAAYMLIFARIGGKPWGPIPAKWARRLTLLALWLFITLALGLTGGGVDSTVFARIGGFVAGLMLTETLLKRRFQQR